MTSINKLTFLSLISC